MKKYKATIIFNVQPFSATDEENAEMQTDKFISFINSALKGIVGMYPYKCTVRVEEVRSQ